MAKRFDLVGEVRRSIETETGEKTPRFVAEVWVDRMCYSFCESFASEPEYAVRSRPSVAHRWKGEDGRRLRAMIKKVGEAS